MAEPVTVPRTSEHPPTLAELAGEIARRLVGKPLFWIFAVAVLFAMPLARVLLTPAPAPLPVFGTLPKFELRDQFGKRFGTDELAGKVWVANFIFTRCPTICPAFTEKMAKLQYRSRNLGDAIHLVSFSVDPDFDTPERLRAYADAHHASPRLWSFLTGSYDDVKKTVVDGLKIAMGRDPQGTDGAFLGIFHGTHFVLVDQKGRIRGYYDSNDADAGDRVMRDVGLAVNRDGMM